jgi:protein TonB
VSGAIFIALPTERRPVAGSDGKTGDGISMALASADRPAPHLPARREHWSLIGLLILSVLVHSALLGVFVQAPQELPSIGIPAISVEIVIGDDAPAGVAATPGQEGPMPANKEVTPERTETATPEGVRPDETRSTTEAVVASEPKPVTPTAPEPRLVAPEPEPVVVEAHPRVAEVESPPIAPQTTEEASPVKPVKPVENPEPDAKPQTPASAPAAPSGSGIGRGRSSPDANYASLVAARLARHKQFPAEARRRRQQGSASVTFNIDGTGRVTEVRLVGSAGSAILDREAQSMVRRASPFPPPPGGLPRSFTVPVSFSMR